MAAQSAHDVVNQVRSVGDLSPSDDSASTINQPPAVGKGEQPPTSISSTAAAPNTITTTATTATTTIPATHETPSAPQMTDGAAEGSTASDEQAVSGRRPGGEEQLTGAPQSNQNAKGSEPERRDRAQALPTPQTNGEKFEGSDAGDSVAAPASADTSVGSDAEQARSEHPLSSTLSDADVKGHNRSNSVKKPASFKAVSVTKNFLAKAANGTVQPSKLGPDKATATTPATPNGQPPTSNATAISRPRLVAKSGSGRDGGLRGSTLPAGNGRGKAPDPSQVWNKNRPVQPPPPKHFTDEELKQQYGIHLATRLQADETSKEAKWADIDDDDDDWAPEIIEWNDGTKITLATLDEQTNLRPAKDSPDASQVGPKDKLGVVPKPVDVPAANRVSSDPPEPASTEPTAATPAAATLTNTGQQKSGGLVLKGASEKPTLVAKPPAPVPVKSPWAPLPPVEKVPPVTIKPQPPQQPQAVERGLKDPPSAEAPHALPSPAKEIAADDFNRSWRENPSVPNRELYNSHSGRYEPVGDNRRGSLRGEPHFRQPSVLQRPLHSDHKGPAEPSAAFQTSRSSGQEVAWGRRRTSSNVSGGSGNLARHMSIGRGSDLHSPNEIYSGGRRGSHQAAHAESVSSPMTTQSQSSLPDEHAPHRGRGEMQRHRQPAGPVPPPVNVDPVHESGSAPDSLPRAPAQPTGQDLGRGGAGMLPPPPPPMEDPIALQKKIMHESRELARKRRREQEEKEEAEKQERIRKKLEALGPADQKTEKSTGSKLTQGSAAPTQVDKVSASPKPAPAKAARSPEVPPKPPVPEASGEVKQYGMMKVHHPEPVRKPTSSRAPVAKTGNTDYQQVENQMPSPPSAVDPPRLDSERHLTNGVSRTSPSDGDRTTASDMARHSPPSHHRPPPQPWSKTSVPPAQPADTRKSWGGAAMSTRNSQISQLWGSPSSDRTPLGNGAFQGEYSSLSGRDNRRETPNAPASAARDPGPIGPPATAPLASLDKDVGQIALTTRLALNSSSRTVSSLDHHHHHPDRTFHTRLGTDIVAPNEPGGPSSSIPARMNDQQRAIASWKNLPSQLEAQDAEAIAKASRDRLARVEEQTRLGSKSNAHLPAFKETWRQVILDDTTAHQRKLVGVSKVTRATDDQDPPVPAEERHSQAPSTAAAVPVHPTPITLPTTAGHSSRFFPPAVDAHPVPVPRTIQGPTVADDHAHPPPESTDHPAYDGDASHPLVSLSAPKPIVRLPPLLGQRAGSSEAHVAPKAADAPRSLPRHIEPAPSWQDKIYGLFNRKSTVAPKSQALTVSSASKAPLEVAPTERSATVSLPVRSGTGTPTGHGGSTMEEEEVAMTSRAADDVLFEEREFGSLPTVKLPARAPANAWQPARAPTTPRGKSRLPKPVQACSIESFVMERQLSAQGHLVIEFHMPGSSRVRFVKGRPHETIRVRTPSSPTGQWRGDNKRKGTKSRESSSGSFPHPAQAQQPASRPVFSGPAGPAAAAAAAPLPGANTTNNQQSNNPTHHTGSNNNATWARRVSGMVQ